MAIYNSRLFFISLSFQFLHLDFLLVHMNLSFFLSIFYYKLFALDRSPLYVCKLLFFILLLKKLLNQLFLVLFLIKIVLSSCLINYQFSSSTFSFLRSEILQIFTFFYFIHCSGIGKVLNLPRRNTFLFFHSFQCVFNIRIFFYSKFLKILFEFINTTNHFFCCFI